MWGKSHAAIILNLILFYCCCYSNEMISFTDPVDNHNEFIQNYDLVGGILLSRTSIILIYKQCVHFFFIVLFKKSNYVQVFNNFFVICKCFTGCFKFRTKGVKNICKITDWK